MMNTNHEMNNFAMSPIYQELHRWASKPFIWGEVDCMMCIADWIMRVRNFNPDNHKYEIGVDPAAEIRGTYDSRGSCQRETGFLRDPIVVVEKCLSSIGGLKRTEEPMPGDMAIILMQEEDGRVGYFGAIWLGSLWGCKGPEGTMTVSPKIVHKVLAIWSVGYAT